MAVHKKKIVLMMSVMSFMAVVISSSCYPVNSLYWNLIRLTLHVSDKQMTAAILESLRNTNERGDRFSGAEIVKTRCSMSCDPCTFKNSQQETKKKTKLGDQ